MVDNKCIGGIALGCERTFEVSGSTDARAQDWDN
jgi:hypothetical protein